MGTWIKISIMSLSQIYMYIYYIPLDKNNQNVIFNQTILIFDQTEFMHKNLVIQVCTFLNFNRNHFLTADVMHCGASVNNGHQHVLETEIDLWA